MHASAHPLSQSSSCPSSPRWRRSSATRCSSRLPKSDRPLLQWDGACSERPYGGGGLPLSVGHEPLHPALHLLEVDRGVTAGTVGELHRQAEDRKFAGHVAQTGHHVTLAGHGDDRARPPLTNHAPGELSPRRHEDRHLIAPRDLENPVERLLGEAPRNQYQQLALPYLAPAALRQAVVHIDRGMLHVVALAKRARQKRREVHELEIGAALKQPLGKQVAAAIVRARDEAKIERAGARENRQRDPEYPGERRPQRHQPRTDQIKKKGDSGSRHDHRERGKAKEHAWHGGKVAAAW